MQYVHGGLLGCMGCSDVRSVKLDLKVGVAEEGGVFVHQAGGCHAAVFGVQLDADAVSARV